MVRMMQIYFNSTPQRKDAMMMSLDGLKVIKSMFNPRCSLVCIPLQQHWRWHALAAE